MQGWRLTSAPRDDSDWLQRRRGSADRNAISHTRSCSNLFPEFFKVFTAPLDTVPSYIYKKLKRLSSGFNRSPGPDLTDFAQGLQLFISPLPPALFPPLVPLVPLHHRRLYIPFPSSAPRINRQFLVLFLSFFFFMLLDVSCPPRRSLLASHPGRTSRASTGRGGKEAALTL